MYYFETKNIKDSPYMDCLIIHQNTLVFWLENGALKAKRVCLDLGEYEEITIAELLLRTPINDCGEFIIISPGGKELHDISHRVFYISLFDGERKRAENIMKGIVIDRRYQKLFEEEKDHSSDNLRKLRREVEEDFEKDPPPPFKIIDP